VINFIRKFFGPKVLQDVAKQSPEVKGYLKVEARRNGKLVTAREGFNIWTLTGREFLAETIALKSLNPTRERVRSDCVAFIGMGKGAQPEVSNILSLVDPTPYIGGQFLARVSVPATFPVSGVDAARTSVQFIREFGLAELSLLGSDVILTEAGLFTDGDPDDNWAIPAPTSFVSSSGRAPVAYKTFEPITKTPDLTLRTVWEVRFI
jgi:hypothetical protein